MRRSYLRLVGTSVLVCWIVGFGILFAYAQTLNWNEDQARHQGLYWVHAALDGADDAERQTILASTAGHFAVELELQPIATVEQRIGTSVAVGESYFDLRDPRAQWMYLPLSDGRTVLVGGPFDPRSPRGYRPIGLFLAILFTPVVASMVTLRLATQLRKVEEASEALGAGVLSARVDNPGGPSHELAAKFNAMAERIERLIKDRDELVQAVSHELGSPLSRLQFQLELLEGEDDPALRQERIDAMTRELDELHELVAELMGWVQSDAAALRCVDFDAAKPLADLVDLAQLHAPEAGELEVRAELPDQVHIHADPKLFQRAVENLLRNAVRYGDRVVALSLEPTEDHVAVIVDDDGPGVPVEDRERVLDPFARLEADRDRDTGGAGLGLAIVSRIVHHHGGLIRVDDAPLGGARVITTWPKATSSDERATLRTASLQPSA